MLPQPESEAARGAGVGPAKNGRSYPMPNWSSLPWWTDSVGATCFLVD
jgi:hypothetical protein